MLEVRVVNGKQCPVAVCDFCGQPIESAGNVLWNYRDDDLKKPEGPLYAHKMCDAESAEHRQWATEDLDVWLVRQLANLFKPDVATKAAFLKKVRDTVDRAELLGSIGL